MVLLLVRSTPTGGWGVSWYFCVRLATKILFVPSSVQLCSPVKATMVSAIMGKPSQNLLAELFTTKWLEIQIHRNCCTRFDEQQTRVRNVKIFDVCLIRPALGNPGHFTDVTKNRVCCLTFTYLTDLEFSVGK